jgi:LysR family nod box-dependent transcriptional activator
LRLESLDINLVIALEAIIRLRSVSAAGEEMGLSQPAVSRALARLREHFGDEIVVSIDRQMVPTEFGGALYDMAAGLLSEMRIFARQRPGFDPGNVSRTFSIVASDYVSRVYLTRLMRGLAEVAPRVSLRIVSIDISTDAMFERGEIDFRIVPRMVVESGHPAALLFEDDFVCVAWSGNDRIGETLDLETFLGLRHIVNAFGSNARDSHLENYLKSNRVPIDVAVSVPNFMLLPEFVIGTPFIATIHRRLARLLHKDLPLRFLPSPLDVPRIQEHLQWHKSRNRDVAVRWMRDFMLSTAQAADA